LDLVGGRRVALGPPGSGCGSRDCAHGAYKSSARSLHVGIVLVRVIIIQPADRLVDSRLSIVPVVYAIAKLLAGARKGLLTAKIGPMTRRLRICSSTPVMSRGFEAREDVLSGPCPVSGGGAQTVQRAISPFAS